jgi:hypothetical protein
MLSEIEIALNQCNIDDLAIFLAASRDEDRKACIKSGLSVQQFRMVYERMTDLQIEPDIIDNACMRVEQTLRHFDL